MVKKTINLQYYEAVGRRKGSVARVRLYIADKNKNITVNGKKLSQGEIIVNNKLFNEVFKREVERQKFLFPLNITDNRDRFTISVLVKGGGKTGQLDAIRHGLARALSLVDEDACKPTLRHEGLLTRDARVRERRKVGMGGKARRKKQSPKR
ncbi:MAG: 30S ribosomal protein S9 [Candidatus Roizmanbacteria bacterium]|nr:MAG: 30S ribosomal protein S9 [Candidatus Roizmanbacteria bacterium]